MSFQKAQWTSVPGFIGSRDLVAQYQRFLLRNGISSPGSPGVETEQGRLISTWSNQSGEFDIYELNKLNDSTDSWDVCGSQQASLNPIGFLMFTPSVRLPSELVDVGFKPTRMIGEACKCWDPQIQWNIAEKIWNTKFGEETNYTQA